MKLFKHIVKGGALILAALAAFAIGAMTADATSNAPPWVRSDGSVDVSKLPACFPVIGRDGNYVLDRQRKKVCIPSRDIYGPPPTTVSDQDARSVIRRERISDGGERVTVEMRPIQP